MPLASLPPQTSQGCFWVVCDPQRDLTEPYSQNFLPYSLLLPSDFFRRKKSLPEVEWLGRVGVIVLLLEKIKNWQVVKREALAGIVPQ